MIWRRKKPRSPWAWKQALLDKAKQLAAEAHAAHVANVTMVRIAVFYRERNTCRAWLDGHRFPWCTRLATDMHEGKSRGAGGAVSVENSVALCHACHMKKHGIGAWLRIVVTDANDPDGVRFIERQSTRRVAA